MTKDYLLTVYNKLLKHKHATYLLYKIMSGFHTLS